MSCCQIKGYLTHWKACKGKSKCELCKLVVNNPLNINIRTIGSIPYEMLIEPETTGADGVLQLRGGLTIPIHNWLCPIRLRIGILSITEKTAKILKRFIYLGDLPKVIDDDNLQELYILSLKYEIDPIKNYCFNMLKNTPSIHLLNRIKWCENENLSELKDILKHKIKNMFMETIKKLGIVDIDPLISILGDINILPVSSLPVGGVPPSVPDSVPVSGGV